MEINDYILAQMRQHVNYANSFKPAAGGDHYHPKTGKRLNYNLMLSLIDKDARKRASAIVNRINSSRTNP